MKFTCCLFQDPEHECKFPQGEERSRDGGGAEVTAGAQDFHVGAVRELFTLSGLGVVPGYLYDVTSDGQKFLVIQDLVHTSTAPLTLVVNWDAELKKK